MKCFAKIVNSQKPFTVFVKCSISDIWQGFKYVANPVFFLKDGKLVFSWHSVKVGPGPRDPPQSLKVGPQDPLQNLTAGS